jgi:signal transduction histidine kinase
VEDIQNENVKIMISVEDQGIGINEQDQKNLFKLYFVTTDKTSKQIN